MHLLRVSGWVAGLAYGHLLLLGSAKYGYFSTPRTIPRPLVEPPFITNPFEGSIAASSRGQQVIADGLPHAIEQYFAPPAPRPVRRVRPGQPAGPAQLGQRRTRT